MPAAVHTTEGTPVVSTARGGARYHRARHCRAVNHTKLRPIEPVCGVGENCDTSLSGFENQMLGQQPLEG